MPPVTGGAEGLNVPRRPGATADHRPPEVKIGQPRTERSAAPDAAAALSIKDYPDLIKRNVDIAHRHIPGIHHPQSRAPGSHAERYPFQTISVLPHRR